MFISTILLCDIILLLFLLLFLYMFNIFLYVCGPCVCNKDILLLLLLLYMKVTIFYSKFLQIISQNASIIACFQKSHQELSTQ